MPTRPNKAAPANGLPPHSKIPTAEGSVEVERLHEALFTMSSRHAQRAVASIGVTDSLELIDQAISIGASVELLAKALLARIDPHLVRSNKNGSSDTTLALIGNPKFEHGLPRMNTIGGKDAVLLLAQVTTEPIRPTDVLDQIFATRDAAVHLGVVDPTSSDKALGQLVRLAKSMLKDEWDDYWQDQVEAANQRLTRAVEEVATRYDQALATALRTFQQRWGCPVTGPDSERLASVRALLEEKPPRLDADDEVSRHQSCPACHSQGWVVLEKERGMVEVDDGDAPHGLAWFVRLIGTPLYFLCAICDLYLDEDDLGLAGISQIDLDEEDEATEEEIELWRGMQYEDAVDAGYEGF